MSGVCFIHMPFAQLGHPSMALSVLAGECRANGIRTSVLYGNLRLARRSSLKKYLAFVQYLPYFTLIGELLFKPYAGYTDNHQPVEYFDYVRDQLIKSGQSEMILEQALTAYHELEPFIKDFIEELSDAVIASGCLAVGCDITYEQRNAALAILKRIKEKKPEIITLLGGNSCTGEHGQALVDYAKQIDYLFSGEADDIIVPVLRMFEKGASATAVNKIYPSVLIAGSQTCCHARENLEENVIPDFSDYFAELEHLDLQGKIRSCLLIEGSRGCWWGQKKRCSFCGIHTSEETLSYRQKSPEKIVEELRKQAAVYNIRAFVFTDCILSWEHINKLPLYLTEKDAFHLFAEVKSNLTQEQIWGLRKAGFISLQPGIESLQDDLLKLMNKGNRAIKHIELLKYGRTYGISMIWNLLSSMPFEETSYYEEMNKLLPWLTHLQPPIHLNKIIFQKNSCYTQRQEEYGLQLRPIYPYNFIGDFGDDFIERSAEYYQECSGRFKFSEPMLRILTTITENLDVWTQAFSGGNGDRLTMHEDEQGLDIFDLRKHSSMAIYRLEGNKKEIFLASASTVDLQTLQQRFPQIQQDELDDIIRELEGRHLIIKIGNEVLALATPQPSLAYVVDPLLPTGEIILGDE